MEIPGVGGGGEYYEARGMENPGGGGGSNLKKPSVGGMDIFWNHTFEKKINLLVEALTIRNS